MSQVMVGIRELKARLSYYIDQVENGATLVVTVRGKPVGRIVPMSLSTEERMKAAMDAGVIRWSGRKLRPIEPVAHTQGPRTLADLVVEDRE